MASPFRHKKVEADVVMFSHPLRKHPTLKMGNGQLGINQGWNVMFCLVHHQMKKVAIKTALKLAVEKMMWRFHFLIIFFFKKSNNRLVFYVENIEHGKATVLEGKVTRVVILSVHHGVYQIWGPITLKPLESFELPIPHLKDPINVRLELEVQVVGISFRYVFRKSNYPQIST